MAGRVGSIEGKAELYETHHRSARFGFGNNMEDDGLRRMGRKRTMGSISFDAHLAVPLEKPRLCQRRRIYLFMQGWRTEDNIRLNRAGLFLCICLSPVRFFLLSLVSSSKVLIYSLFRDHTAIQPSAYAPNYRSIDHEHRETRVIEFFLERTFREQHNTTQSILSAQCSYCPMLIINTLIAASLGAQPGGHQMRYSPWFSCVPLSVGRHLPCGFQTRFALIDDVKEDGIL